MFISQNNSHQSQDFSHEFAYGVNDDRFFCFDGETGVRHCNLYRLQYFLWGIVIQFVLTADRCMVMEEMIISGAVPMGYCHNSSCLSADKVFAYATNSAGGHACGVLAYGSQYALWADGDVHISGDLFYFSDKRFKENIRPIEKPLAKVMALQGTIYDRKEIRKGNASACM